MTNRGLLIFGIIIFLTGIVIPAGIADADGPVIPDNEAATSFIKDLSSRAIEILRDESVSLQEREQVFQDMLEEGFALDFIGRFVLGRNYRTTTKEQRSDYQSLFEVYVLKTYTTRLGAYADQRFVVQGARAAGKRDLFVNTEVVQTDGPPIKVDWRIRNFDGLLQVIDVNIEGISMALTQRQEFASVIQKNGIDGLLEMLRARIGKAS